MKKIAFYVEGQTEQFFINKLLIEIAGQKNIRIELRQFKGVGKPTIDIYPRTTANPDGARHGALIFDCMGDGSVKTRMLEQADRHFSEGYDEIVGIRDLYPFPLTELARLETSLLNGLVRDRVLAPPLPPGTSIIVAVREVEDWFLAECSHFSRIDAILTEELIKSNLPFNPWTDDLTARSVSAAADMKSVYQLAGKTYSKKQGNVERTVECLDYANLYLMVKDRPGMGKLNGLIAKIDAFLS